MTHIEIREKFLKFFEERGHKIVPSSSLLPDELSTDKSALFTTAGMQPMVPYLLGQKHPLGTRISNSQKCFRSQDIEEVGDSRHTTFFEMLGNWSFGDYFKKEQLHWVFEFLTKELELDPKRLYVTVFEGNDQIPRDNESVELWKELFSSVGVEAREVENSNTKGMQDGRIFYYGVEKNWWSLSGTPEQMSVGDPGGPDSEMFYEFPDIKHDVRFGEYCHVNCDCGRYIEIGNNVFMEYQKQEEGPFKLLEQKNIDFGGGLERMTMAYEDKSDIFETDVFKSMIASLEKVSGIKYKDDSKRNFRIISDHVKAAVMLIADGAIPSNKSQGYLVRRLIRRAVRYARLLDDQKVVQLLTSAGETVFDVYSNLIVKGENEIMKTILGEAGKFTKTLDAGLKVLTRQMEAHIVELGRPYHVQDLSPVEGAEGLFPGFTPLHITGKWLFDFYQSFGFPFELTIEVIQEALKRRYISYEIEEFKKAFDEEFKKHQEISKAGAEKKFGGHGLILDTGELKAGNEEELKIVARLHTATHMLHAALRKILGEEVHQAGSDITAERLRFDFTFPRKVNSEEIKKVEELVNQVIKDDLKVTKEEMPYEDAVKTGALSFFKLKYPPIVNVFTIGGTEPAEVPFSRELCGGPHVTHIGEIGHFKITKEEASSAGVRRIRAIVE